MKSKSFTTSILLFLLVFLMQGSLFAQADIVDVPHSYDGSTVGAINKFIGGDTTATGERNNPDRIYRLERNRVYIMDAILIADYKLNVIGAEQVDPNDGTKPPILMPAVLSDGTYPEKLFHLYDNTIFRNFAAFGHTPDGNKSIARFIEILADSVKLELYDMRFEGFRDQVVLNLAKDGKVIIEDVYARRLHWVSPFSGAFLHNNVNSDTTIIRNCTIANGGAYLIVQRYPSNYTLIDHNTVVNGLANPFFTPMVHNFHVTNNIFKNLHIYAQNRRENKEGWFDWDGIPSSLMSTDTISIKWADTLGYKNETRTFRVTNNAYFWDQKVHDLWATLIPYTGGDDSWPANDTLRPVEFMNSRTKAFFDNDTEYPNMVEMDNYNEDPSFTKYSEENLDRYIEFTKKWRAGRTDYLSNGFFTIDNDGNEALMEIPQPEDYTYSNATLLTGGTDGFPVGDLNWYPEKKAQWIITDVEEEGYSSIPEEFELSQNYPNPFNPSTIITYNVPQTSNVTLKVYNILGSEVATLVNEVKNKGNYSVEFSTASAANNLSSGIYFYSLKSGSISIVKKMMLLK